MIHDRAQASNLQPGLPPQLVGALLPSGAMNSTPLPSGSLPRPPGLNKPRPVVASPSPAGGVTPNPVNRRAPGPEPISGWRVVYVAVVLVLAFLLLFGSDPLKGILDLESARQHARNEGATLAFEKEKTEHERKMMARERELWEKARDARLPQGAFWDVVWPAWECLAYGKREYWGVLRNIPEGWDAMDACMNMPVEIKGVKLRRPNRCSHYFEFPERQVRGYWVVDWDQPDCKPWYRDFEDKVGPNLPLSHEVVFIFLRTGMHELQIRKTSNPSPDHGHQHQGEARLAAAMQNYTFGLGHDHVYKPYRM